MQTADFDYDLPQELIAQTPIEPRDAARLLVLDRQADLRHQQVSDLPQLLDPGDLLVVNRSRVLPGRIHGRLRGGGRAELLLLRRLGPGRWQALGRPARRLRPDATVSITPGLAVRIVGLGEAGLREVCVESNDDQATDPDAALLAAGSLPLPPYIHTPIRDPERYQTIFADVDGSAAAPTAGLHFTPALLDRLRERGVGLTSIVLHVGLDTFRPVATADPRGHPMHREWYTLDDDTAARIAATRQVGRRVVAVGTTCVRALESWASRGGASQGWTDLFILPGYHFQVVDALLTNFHLPRSTLLMLVSAFAGRERVLAAYAEAIRRGYRFYSFGDAMLVL